MRAHTHTTSTCESMLAMRCLRCCTRGAPLCFWCSLSRFGDKPQWNDQSFFLPGVTSRFVCHRLGRCWVYCELRSLCSCLTTLQLGTCTFSFLFASPGTNNFVLHRKTKAAALGLKHVRSNRRMADTKPVGRSLAREFRSRVWGFALGRASIQEGKHRSSGSCAMSLGEIRIPGSCPEHVIKSCLLTS